MTFPFQDLRVYQLTLEYIGLALTISQQLSKHSLHSLANQLTRASTSIALNIAEGNGRWHKAEKRQFFWIARGSVFECVAIIQILKKRSIVTEEKYRQIETTLESIAKMLTKLIQSVENLQGKVEITL